MMRFAIPLLACGFFAGCGSANEPTATYRPRSEPGPPPPGSELPPGAHAYRILSDTDYHLVRVFYATDRAPIADKDPVTWRLFLPTVAAATATLILVIGLSSTSRPATRGLFAILSALSLGATVWFAHSEIIRGQQLRRATEYGDRAYASGRHEEVGRPILELGTCQVSIPPDHRVGYVESPSVLRLEFREDPQKHVVLHRVVRRQDAAFFGELNAAIDSSKSRQAFVFIHGYNVGFDDAIKRTAQIAYDLRFDGAAICYSWPSQGGLARYTQDETNASWTVLQLESFLTRVARQTNAKRIHLVAHSMGNRALMQALERLALRDSSSPVGFHQIIMAAPDVDSAEFRTRYAPVITRLAKRTTLYASSNDRALQASTKVHGYTRAGLSGDYLTVIPGLDTVDASPIDTSLIGHSYYGDNPLMIYDLEAVLDHELPAENREWLRRILRQPSVTYWAFRQDFPQEIGVPEDL